MVYQTVASPGWPTTSNALDGMETLAGVHLRRWGGPRWGCCSFSSPAIEVRAYTQEVDRGSGWMALGIHDGAQGGAVVAYRALGLK